MKTRKLKKMAGKRFGKLTVLDRAPNRKNKNDGHAQWYCICDCGEETVVGGTSLRRGQSRSCGCSLFKHGFAKRGRIFGEYYVWASMKQRCYNEKYSQYKDYGGRGISVCEEWNRSFLSFLKDMGMCPKKKTLERIDNNGNYEPSNCKWTTRYEQSRNGRRNVWVEYNGERMILADFASKIGINASAIRGFRENNSLTLKETISFYSKKYA